MRRRLAAATAGAVLIAAAMLAFSLGKHPVIADTNSAAPLLPAVGIESGETRCQPLSRVPAGADHVRVVISSISGTPGPLAVNIRPLHGPPISSGRGTVGLAGKVIRLEAPTKTLHPARFCLHYFGPGHVILAGEKKHIPARGSLKPMRKRAVASIVFLRPGLASWASRRDEIADRYANSQASPFGQWSLWVAVLAAIGASVLALWWLVFGLEPRRGQS